MKSIKFELTVKLVVDIHRVVEQQQLVVSVKSNLFLDETDENARKFRDVQFEIVHGQHLDFRKWIATELLSK